MGLVLGLRLICRVFMFCAEEIYLGLSRFAPVFETLRHEGTKGHKVDYYDFLIVLFFYYLFDTNFVSLRDFVS